MLRNHDLCQKYDLSSARVLVTGAAPLGEETAADFLRLYPKIKILQAYGMHSLRAGPENKIKGEKKKKEL